MTLLSDDSARSPAATSIVPQAGIHPKGRLRLSEKLPLPPWPNGAAVSVSLSFDFDADSGAGWRGLGDKLSTLSGYRFGARRGIHRILDLLDRHAISATF